VCVARNTFIGNKRELYIPIDLTIDLTNVDIITLHYIANYNVPCFSRVVLLNVLLILVIYIYGVNVFIGLYVSLLFVDFGYSGDWPGSEYIGKRSFITVGS